MDVAVPLGPCRLSCTHPIQPTVPRRRPSTIAGRPGASRATIRTTATSAGPCQIRVARAAVTQVVTQCMHPQTAPGTRFAGGQNRTPTTTIIAPCPSLLRLRTLRPTTARATSATHPLRRAPITNPEQIPTAVARAWKRSCPLAPASVPDTATDWSLSERAICPI